MRENNAEILVNTIIGGTDISDLVISILIIGVLTGISEELFFSRRTTVNTGAFHRKYSCCNMADGLCI